MINSQRGPNDKSIDTLMLELEEKELQTKLQHFGNSFITESENLFEQDEKFYSKSKSNEESVIVRDHIKHESNLKNLNKQFRYNNAIQNTSRDKNANRKEENKTTAATSNRKHHFEENARSNNNNENKSNSSRKSNNMPFEYNRSEIYKSNNQNDEFNQSSHKIIKKHDRKEESKNTEGIRIASGYSKSRYIKEVSSRDDAELICCDASIISNHIFKCSLNATNDLFIGFLDFFNYDDSSED